jgi:hypothetical protein
MFWRTVHDFSKWAPVALAAVFTAFVTATLGAAAIWDGAKVWAQNAFEGVLDMAALPWIWLLAAAIVLLWLLVVIWSGRKVASQDRENLLDQDRAQALREVADLRNMTDSITARAPMVDYDDPYREVDRLRTLMNTLGMDRKAKIYFGGVCHHYKNLRVVRSLETQTKKEIRFRNDQNGWHITMLSAHADALAGWLRGERVWRRFKRALSLLEELRPEHTGYGFKKDEAGKWRLCGYAGYKDE